jgi:hypothetical protein
MFKIVSQKKTIFKNLTNLNRKNLTTTNSSLRINSKQPYLTYNSSFISTATNTNNKKQNNNFYKLTKYNFVSDGANPKLKKKFYNKTEIAVMHISNKNEFLTLNELQNLENQEDHNNENNLKNEISEILQEEKLANLLREEMQFEIFKLKLKNFDEFTQKNFIKNFDKLRTLFTGSLFHKKYYGVLLDNRKCKSMHLDELKIPTKRLALALSEEWQSQKDIINLYKMHLVIL